MRIILSLLLTMVLSCASASEVEEKSSISNSIKWATASELNNFGFDVYRSDNEDGPFERINARTIPGAGNSDTPSRYQYIDDAIESGATYWYYVESISMSGEREKFTPTFQSKPKFPESEG